MITIKKQNSHISIDGHAGYAPAGQDIVCAAISVLTDNMIRSIEHLTEDMIKYAISPGRVDIDHKVLTKEAQLLVDAFLLALKRWQTAIRKKSG